MTTKKSKIRKLLNISCAGCGGCCSDMAVPVTDTDVRRLMEVSGLPASKIVKMLDKNEIDWEEDRDGWIHLHTGKRIMGLRKKKSRCLFLDSDNLCTVYGGRPATCRTFPFEVELDDDGEIEAMSINKGLKCRHKRNGGDMTEEEVIQDTLTEDANDDDYYLRLREWNEEHAGGRKKDFLKFLGLA